MLASLLLFSILLCRILTGATLLLAGISKIRIGHNRFLQAIMGYDLIPKNVASIMARFLPWLELITGSMLLVGLYVQVATLIAFGLFLLFCGVVTISLLRGKNNDCGCFRTITPVQWRLVFRNVFLMGLLIPVFAFKGGIITIDNWLPIRFGMNYGLLTLSRQQIPEFASQQAIES
jgi:putative oxidoreductase